MFYFSTTKEWYIKGENCKKRREVYAKNIIRVSFFGDY
jgi:hypothetical protein